MEFEEIREKGRWPAGARKGGKKKVLTAAYIPRI